MNTTLMRRKGRGRLVKRLLAVAIALLLCLPVTALAAEPAETGETMAGPRSFRYEGMSLCPGGCAFGVKFSTKGVLVVGLSPVKREDGKEISPAETAGVKVKDILLAVNETEIHSVKDLAEMVTASEGKPLTLSVERGGKTGTLTLTPVKTKEGYKAGMWLRDSTAGIGTVTYVNPETGEFGGLGHGICDVDTGVLMPLDRGSVMKVEIGGVVKGLSGKPGEIKGYFKHDRCGSIMSNTLCGVFGIFTEMPEGISEAVPVGSRHDVKEGEAEIICTLGDDGPKHYKIEISKIDRDGTDNKNFVITVTDKTLKERTGGIVQGMSGSPILQNGKLIGAVTHVLVNDPAKGYGIFIENMLDAAG
ncbi:MAG: SpoIVB peptidase [Clostridia bacterium]|nr:SpoIVB peptidase [Clostridia bacterium]